MKNRWDVLKKKYSQWKTLNMRATGLGRDPVTGCISASDEWWADQNAAMPGCISFKNSVLEHEDMMRIMFEAISVTNETVHMFLELVMRGERRKSMMMARMVRLMVKARGVHHRSPQVLTKGQLHLQGEPQVPLLERKRKHIGIPL
ncbi:hypothetical protein PVAP13_2NG401203 [Panicum virgatum]|uniref:Myb/SANT-like domain-containing protein n=1 Tax=Panicum virgatum TaxID=38727 RepID=A0A8T0VSY7_PANVG|nr:hypothetical protein PVAP13_2NG401203 [Panicum virgatum]